MATRIALIGLLCLAVSGLTGCQSVPNPGLDTLRTALTGANPDAAVLNPAYLHLRVTRGRRVAFFVLGYVDPHPQGPIEVWYSSDRETLRLQNGRVVGLAGTQTEWRQVRLPVLPSWSALLSLETPATLERIRDVMPGYRFNVLDRLQVQAIAAPGKSALAGLDPARLRWFEERILATAPGEPALPPARYALQPGPGVEPEVVYGEQCVSPALCFSWQRWKVQP